jgi:hypothetical protein
LLIRGFDALHTAVAGCHGTDPLERLRAFGMCYRAFALDKPQYYAVMFQGALPRTPEYPVVAKHAATAFGVLVTHVSTAMGAGRILSSDPLEVAQQIWASVHGAVSLELGGLVLTSEAKATYNTLLDHLLRSLHE